MCYIAVVCESALVNMNMSAGSMSIRVSASACLYVLRARYLNGKASQGTLGNCTLLLAKSSLCWYLFL